MLEDTGTSHVGKYLVPKIRDLETARPMLDLVTPATHKTH